MTRRVNKRFLIRTAGILAVFALSVHVVHAVQLHRQANALVRQATQAESAGDLHRAAMYLHTYLGHVPGDTAALANYAKVLAAGAKTPAQTNRALQVLEQVLRREPDRRAEREEAVRLALQLEQYDDVARHLEALRVVSDDKADVSEALGWAFVGLGRPAQAAEAFQDAIRLGPGRLNVYVKLADLYARELSQPDRAGPVMEDLVTANPHSAAAYLARARWREGRGLLDDAAADVKRALDLAPTDGDVLLAAAEFSRRHDRPEEARARLARGFAARPDDPRLRDAAANLAWQEGRTQTVLEHLKQGLEKAPNDVRLLVQLAEALLDEGKAAEAQALRERLAKAPEPGMGLAYLDARLLMQKGDWIAATRALEKAWQETTSPVPWAVRFELALARCYAHGGDAARRLQATARALRLNPASAAARTEHATALQEAGRAEEAADEWRRVLARPGTAPSAWVALGRALLAQQLQRSEEQRDWAEVERACREASRVVTDASPVLLVAALRVAQERAAEADDLLTEASELSPNSADIQLARIDLASDRGRFAEAGKLVAAARKRFGDRADLSAAAIRLVRRQLAQKKVDGAQARRELAALGSGVDKFPPAEQGYVLQALADAWWQMGDVNEALRVARLWTQRQPESLSAWLALFDVAIPAGDEAAARQALAGLRRAEGDNGVRWRTGEAWLAIERARHGTADGLPAARARLEEAARLQPEWGRTYFLRAQLAELAGKPEVALAYYERAFDRGERGPEVAVPLVRDLLERNRVAEADRVLRRVQEQTTELGPLLRPAVEVARRLRDYRQAVDLTRRVVPADAADYRDHLWLARLLEEAGQPAEAEAVLRRTVARFPEASGVWVALVQTLARAGRRDAGATVLHEAEHKLHGPTATLQLARCSEALGRTAEAEERYQQALAASPDSAAVLHAAATYFIHNDQPGRALPLLRALQSPSVEATPEVAAWARREMAQAVAAPGTADAIHEAVRVLESAEPSNTLADRRARAFVIGQRPDRRSQALRSLNDTLAHGSLTPDEQYRLALLYDAVNDRPHARELYFSLLQDHPREPQYLAGLTRSLLARGDLDEAKHWLNRLEQVEPDSSRTRALQVELARRVEAAAM